MTAASLSRPAQVALAAVFALTLWRLLILAFDAPPLSFDEAQYWLWAQSFQFGYFSKPPMVAWAIGATTAVCGDGEGCVKAGSALAYMVGALALYGVGAALYDRRVGLWSALLFATLPAVSLSSMIISTDPFLLAFWAVALFCLVRALQTGAAPWWLALGLAVGAGMLAKYAMLLFLGSLLVYLIWSPARRALLKGWQLPVVVGLAALAYVPNLVWNAQNQFVSYAHTKSNANLGGSLFHPEKLAEFVGAQFAVMGPILFALLLWIIIRARREAQDDRARLLLSFVLPTLGLMSAQALLSRANANWSAPAFVAGCVLVAAWGVAHKPLLLRASLVLHIAAAAVLYDYDAIRGAVGLDRTAKYDLMKRVRGWPQAGQEVRRQLIEHPGHGLLADERKVAASLAYYARLGDQPAPVVKLNPQGGIHDHFDQTTAVEAGQPYVYVTDNGGPEAVAAYFDTVEAIEHVQVPIASDYSRELWIYRVAGFKGYGR